MPKLFMFTGMMMNCCKFTNSWICLSVFTWILTFRQAREASSMWRFRRKRIIHVYCILTGIVEFMIWQVLSSCVKFVTLFCLLQIMSFVSTYQHFILGDSEFIIFKRLLASLSDIAAVSYNARFPLFVNLWNECSQSLWMETTVYSHGNIFHCTFSDIMYLFTCCCFLFISILTILYFMAKAVGCLHFAGLYLLCHCWGKHSVTSFHIIAWTDPSCMLILQILSNFSD